VLKSDTLRVLLESSYPSSNCPTVPEEWCDNGRDEAAEVDGGVEHGKIGGHLGPLLGHLTQITVSVANCPIFRPQNTKVVLKNISGRKNPLPEKSAAEFFCRFV
jgi:hypothetical protein